MIPTGSAPAGKAEAAPSGGPSDIVRRLTYLMLFRVVVTTLLLGAAVAAGLAASDVPAGDDAAPIERAPTLFAAVGVTYALTLLWAILLQRLRHSPTGARRLALAQLLCDLGAATVLIHVTDGVDSEFVFLYLLVIVGASSVLSRATLPTGAAAMVLYLALAIAGREGWLPLPTTALEHAPPSLLMRTLAVNLVAILATAVLASRLAVELRRAGENLVEQGARLQDLATLHADVVRSLTAGLLTLSPDGRVQSINPAGAEILGCDPARAVGRRVDEVWTGFEAACADGARSPLHRLEVPVAHPDGAERIVGLSVSPLTSAQGAALGRVVSFQDLTELRSMQQQVERDARLAAIGRLAAGVAHEIRNPLAAISGSIELLRSMSDDRGEGQSAELWDIVGREIDRLNAQITSLLEYARPRLPDPTPLDLGVAVAETVRVFQNDRRLGAGRLQLAPSAPLWVDADPGQLRQVLWNLLRNAAEASPGGEPIAITLGAEAASDGEWAWVAIRDRGAGIAEQDRARLFEPFATTKKTGTGLGLATVHRIVSEHRGKIEIGDADGGGAVATVRLPRRASPA